MAEQTRLVDQLALGGAADGGVAGLPGDAIEVEGEEEGTGAHPGGGESRLGGAVTRGCGTLST